MRRRTFGVALSIHSHRHGRLQGEPASRPGSKHTTAAEAVGRSCRPAVRKNFCFLVDFCLQTCVLLQIPAHPKAVIPPLYVYPPFLDPTVLQYTIRDLADDLAAPSGGLYSALQRMLEYGVSVYGPKADMYVTGGRGRSASWSN